MTFPHPDQEYDGALADPEPTKFFGQITRAEQYPGVFVETTEMKEDGKPKKQWQDYDPAAHNGKQVAYRVYMTITPLDPASKLIECASTDRRAVYSFTREWEMMRQAIRKVFPQTKKLSDLIGKFVEGERRPRPDNKPGETWTAPIILRAFASEAECLAASKSSEKADAGGADQPVAAAPNGNGKVNGDDAKAKAEAEAAAQRATFAQFLPGMWAQAGKDKAKMAELLKANPMIGTVFTMDAPEVKAITEA